MLAESPMVSVGFGPGEQVIFLQHSGTSLIGYRRHSLGIAAVHGYRLARGPTEYLLAGWHNVFFQGLCREISGQALDELQPAVGQSWDSPDPALHCPLLPRRVSAPCRRPSGPE